MPSSSYISLAFTFTLLRSRPTPASLLSFMLNAGVAIIVVIFSSSGVSGLVSTSLSLALSLSKGLLSSLASPMQMNGISCLIA